MFRKIATTLFTFVIAAVAAGCAGPVDSNTNTTSTDAAAINNANTANVSTTPATTVTQTSSTQQPQTAADDSEIVTAEEGGVRTETRTFRNNSRVQKVVVTTRNGKRTARVTSRSGEERELPENRVE